MGFVKTQKVRLSYSRIYKIKKNTGYIKKYIEQNKSKLKYNPSFMQNGERVTRATDIAGKFNCYFTVTNFRCHNYIANCVK